MYNYVLIHKTPRRWSLYSTLLQKSYFPCHFRGVVCCIIPCMNTALCRLVGSCEGFLRDWSCCRQKPPYSLHTLHPLHAPSPLCPFDTQTEPQQKSQKDQFGHNSKQASISTILINCVMSLRTNSEKHNLLLKVKYKEHIL